MVFDLAMCNILLLCSVRVFVNTQSWMVKHYASRCEKIKDFTSNKNYFSVIKVRLFVAIAIRLVVLNV